MEENGRGVTTSVEEETDDGSTGTDVNVNGWSGNCGQTEVSGDGVLELYSFNPMTTEIHWAAKKMFQRTRQLLVVL